MARDVIDERIRVFYEGPDPDPRGDIDAPGIHWVDRREDADLVLAPARRLGRTVAGEDAGLTAREDEILGYLADGWSNEEIADRLGISAATVKFHLSGIYRKFGVTRRTEAVREGARRGIIEW